MSTLELFNWIWEELNFCVAFVWLTQYINNEVQNNEVLLHAKAVPCEVENKVYFCAHWRTLGSYFSFQMFCFKFLKQDIGIRIHKNLPNAVSK